MVDHLEDNKRNVVAFHDLMFHVQYNPCAANDKQAFIKQFTRIVAQHPAKCARFKRIIAKCDLVVLHRFQHWPGDRDWLESRSSASTNEVGLLSLGTDCKWYL